MNGHRDADRLARSVILGTLLVAAGTWWSPHKQIPIHWNIAGQVDGYGSKFGILLIPAIALLGYVLIGLIPTVRPDQFDEPTRSALSWLRLAYVSVLGGVSLVIGSDASGSILNMNYVLLPLLALLTIAVVNLIIRRSQIKETPPGGGIRI
jgi:hypothetical protein